jgi:hypothetical protein
LKLDECDFVIVDITPGFLPDWLFPYVHGRFLPAIKLLRLPEVIAEAAIPPLISGQLVRGTGTESDSVIFWRDPQELLDEMSAQLQKFAIEREPFYDFEEGEKYFLGLGLQKKKIFISNAGSARPVRLDDWRSRQPRLQTPVSRRPAYCGRPRNVSGALATQHTIERWNPRYILMTRIAGGLPLNDLARGDVLISSVIWAYEYGKVKAGEFAPRADFTYPVDGGLLRGAGALAIRDPSWAQQIMTRFSQLSAAPKVVIGPVASGDKVIDDASSAFFQ